MSLTAWQVLMDRIEQHDKAEAPVIPDTYIYLLALQSLDAVAEGLYSTASRSAAPEHAVRGMAESAWPALLAALSYCIGSNLSDVLFAEVLCAVQDFTTACGLLGLTTPRDAFLNTLGKYAVPPPVVSAMQTHLEAPTISRSNSVLNADALGFTALGVGGGPASLPSLSERNLACLRSAVVTARSLAPGLGDAWHDILEMLQNANYMLAVRKPNLNRRPTMASPQIGFSPSKAGVTSEVEESRPEVFADLDAESIQAAISTLFDASKDLDDAAFSTFVSALCQLSSEMIGMDAANGSVIDLNDSPVASSNSPFLVNSHQRRTSGINISHSIKAGERSFSLSKLRVVSTLNLSRLVSSDAQLGWTAITQHLLAVARHLTAATTIRTQASDTLGEMLLGAVRVGKESRIQHQVFEVLVRQVDMYPISNTIATDYDVRSSGYQTLNRILESSGHSLEVGWGTIFGMLDAVCQDPTSLKPAESQTAVTPNSRMSAHFSKGDANLVRMAFPSLNLICTDFLSSLDPDAMRRCIACLGCFGRQREDVNITLAAVGLMWNVLDAVQADYQDLWLHLLIELLELGRDSRLEVRSSATQTLFRCVELYGSNLSPSLWEDVFYKVIFPLLDAARGDESHVLALTSVGAIFNTFLVPITALPSFDRIITRLLERLQHAFVSEPRPCCTAALKALERVLLAVGALRKSAPNPAVTILDKSWGAFAEMGDALSTGEPYTQENLVALVRVAVLLHAQVSWTEDRLQLLSSILRSVMTYSRSPEYRPDIDVMSPLQSAISELVATSNHLSPSSVLSDLAEFSSLAYMRDTSTSKLTFIALSKYAMPTMALIFKRHPAEMALYEDGTVERVMGVSPG